MYEPFWMENAASSEVVTSGWHRMAYSFPDYSLLPKELEEVIRKLHAIAKNAITDGKYIVIGVGSTQLLNASVHALSSENFSSSSYSAKVVAKVPYFPTDKASMLDEVIEYLKLLQAQVDAMSKMRHINMSPALMLPNMALQQQHLQMSMMAQSAMGMGGIGMAPNITAMPSVLHSTTVSFIPTGDRVTAASAASVVPDPLASFRLACQSQPMTVDAYRRMAALYQQQYLQSHANLGFKN